MTKKHYALILGLCVLGVIWLTRNETTLTPLHKAPAVTKIKPRPAPVPAMREPAAIPAAIVKSVNSPNKVWKENLETQLREQGGDLLKELTIKEVESFVWKENGLPLQVQSVIVTLKNVKNAETSFRVLVDAQTGKILRSWDAPIFDPISPSEKLTVKLDPVAE